MEPQLSRTDIQMEEMTKKQLSAWTTQLAQTYQKTPHPQGTVRQWLSEEARQLGIVLVLWTSGPEFEWVSWARGQPRMKTRCCAKGQLGHTHATRIHQSGDDS